MSISVPQALTCVTQSPPSNFTYCQTCRLLQSGPPWKCKLMLRITFFLYTARRITLIVKWSGKCSVMKLYNPKRGCVPQARLLTGAPVGCPRCPGGVVWWWWGGGGSPGVELSCVAPGCVRVLAGDKVRGAGRRDLATR